MKRPAPGAINLNVFVLESASSSVAGAVEFKHDGEQIGKGPPAAPTEASFASKFTVRYGIFRSILGCQGPKRTNRFYFLTVHSTRLGDPRVAVR